MTHSIFLLFAVLALRTVCLGQLAYSHDVYRGSLTPVSSDGFWRRYTTAFPIIGGWMEPGSTNSAGNGPNGCIWVHQEGNGWGGQWGAYHTPITIEQFNDPRLIVRTWNWGIYYVYGENKILEYGAFDYQYPPGTVSYLISYSAGVIPEPSSSLLIALGFIGWVSLKRIDKRFTTPCPHDPTYSWPKAQRRRVHPSGLRPLGLAAASPTSESIPAPCASATT